MFFFGVIGHSVSYEWGAMSECLVLVFGGFCLCCCVALVFDLCAVVVFGFAAIGCLAKSSLQGSAALLYDSFLVCLSILSLFCVV